MVAESWSYVTEPDQCPLCGAGLHSQLLGDPAALLLVSKTEAAWWEQTLLEACAAGKAPGKLCSPPWAWAPATAVG